jgi:hypothetical protein
MAKHTYSVQVYIEASAQWHSIVTDESRGFAEGYALGHMDLSAPRLALRVIRDDGKVMQDSAARRELALGMIAGFPTPEQYELAAAEALESARRLREWSTHAAERRPGWIRS